MNKSIFVKLSKLAVAITLAITMAGAPKAHAQDSQEYIYCSLTDSIHSTVYFSDVFAGDYSQSITYELAFTDFVHGQFSNVIGMASCSFERGASRARAAEDGRRSTVRGIYQQLVNTPWKY